MRVCGRRSGLGVADAFAGLDMFAIDTNVVIRYLVNDDAAQGARARALVDRENVWVSRTVVLESAWVLEAVYDFSRKDVIAALEAFFGLATVQVEDEAVVARALASARAGMDVADALHVAGTPAEAEAFLTFDRSLIRTRPKVPRVQIVP